MLKFVQIFVILPQLAVRNLIQRLVTYFLLKTAHGNIILDQWNFLTVQEVTLITLNIFFNIV